MAKRFYTCIIVPSASSRLHKLRIPVHTLYVMAVVGTVSFVVALALGFMYVEMAARISDFEQLQAENHELKIEKKNLEVSTTKLSTRINEVEDTLEKISKVIEGDPTLKRMAVANIKGTGGSTRDYATAELLGPTSKVDLASLKDRAAELGRQSKLQLQKAEYGQTIRQTVPSLWPVRGAIGSYYGSRLDPFNGTAEIHRGLDISGSYNSQIHAPADGIVIYAARQADYGNLIIIKHERGITTRYGHLSHFNVRIAQSVKKGDVIGYVGATGRATAPHLHYEVRVNDTAVDPRKYLP